MVERLGFIPGDGINDCLHKETILVKRADLTGWIISEDSTIPEGSLEVSVKSLQDSGGRRRICTESCLSVIPQCWRRYARGMFVRS